VLIRSSGCAQLSVLLPASERTSRQIALGLSLKSAFKKHSDFLVSFYVRESTKS
jgi:hypothetical protein